LTPLSIREAQAFIALVHRHHRPPQGAKFAVAVACLGRLVGVATAGRPVSRTLDDGYTIEVTRVAVLEGFPNACSKLYAAVWRAARAMGYRKAITYTLPEEGGASVRGAGWRLVGAAGGGSWDRPACGRPRVDTHPTQTKFRWETGGGPAALDGSSAV